MKKLLFVFLSIALFPVSSVVAEEADVAVSQNEHYVVKDRGDKGYSLKGHVSVRRTILTEKGAQSRYCYVHESHVAEVKNLKAKCRKKKIKGHYIVPFRSEEQGMFMSDEIVHAICLPEDLSPGDVIEYEYDEEYSDIAFFPMVWIYNTGRTDAFEITIEHPKNVTVEFEFFFARREILCEISRSDPKVTTLRFGEIEKGKELIYYPFGDLHAAVLITLMRDGVRINPTTVEDLFDWFVRGADLTPELAERHAGILSEELSGAADDPEKLSIIYDWVRENIRYVADTRKPHAYYPHDPSDVLDLRYGDCKDQAYLTAALARQAGIEVWPAQVHTDPQPPFEGLHFLLSNHVICAWNQGDSTVFFDPTASYCNFGNIPAQLIGKTAYVLDTANPRSERIGNPNDYPGGELVISADIDSLDKGRATLVLRNRWLDAEKNVADHGLPGEWKEALHEMCSDIFGPIRLNNFVYDSPDTRGEHGEMTMVVDADADLSALLVSGRSRMYLPQLFMPAYQQKVFEREEDSLPLYFDNPYRVTTTLKLRAPGWDIDTGQIVIGDSNVACYTTRARRMEGDTLQISYDINRQPVYLDGSEKAAFLDFCKQYRDNNNNMYIMTGRE